MNVMSKIAADRHDREAARGERFQLRIQAHGRANGKEPVEFLIHDISAEGMLVEAAEPLHSGDVVEIELLHEVNPPARIVWSSGPFFGCSFLEPIAETLVRNVLLKDAAWSSGRPRDRARLDDGENLATRIVKIRQSHGLTSEEFASRIGVSRQAVWYWETGQRNPRTEQLQKIRAEFGLARESAAGPIASARSFSPGASVSEHIASCRRSIAEVLGVEVERIRISVDW